MKKLVFISVLVLLSMQGIAKDGFTAYKDSQRKNAISLTVYGLAPVAVYERIFPLGEKYGLIGSVGGFYYGKDYLGYTAGATFYVGSDKHKAEFGGVYLNNVLTVGYGAYRFVANSGLFLKGGIGYVFKPNKDFESGPVPVLAAGYAF